MNQSGYEFIEQKIKDGRKLFVRLPNQHMLYVGVLSGEYPLSFLYHRFKTDMLRLVLLFKVPSKESLDSFHRDLKVVVEAMDYIMYHSDYSKHNEK